MKRVLKISSWPGLLVFALAGCAGTWDSYMPSSAPGGDGVTADGHIVNDVTTGSVDAAVAYITDVLANRDRVDMLQIESPSSKAIQCFSVSRSSDFKYLSRRLFQRIAESPEAFEEAGFHYRLADEQEVDPKEGS